MEINGVKIDKSVWRDAEKEHKRKIDEKKESVIMFANERFFPYPSKLASHFEKSLTSHLISVVKAMTSDYEHVNCDTNISIGNSFVCSERFNVAELKHIEAQKESTSLIERFLSENGIDEERAKQASKEQEETLTERLVRIVKTYARDYKENKEG